MQFLLGAGVFMMGVLVGASLARTNLTKTDKK